MIRSTRFFSETTVLSYGLNVFNRSAQASHVETGENWEGLSRNSILLPFLSYGLCEKVQQPLSPLH